ncbi:hypothetical protein PTKU46_79730 [Paraburkholderia terrae]
MFRWGFCYPGRGNGGDKPPRRECAQLWLDSLLEKLTKIQSTLLIDQYAQQHFPGSLRKALLTETVSAWKCYAPAFVPLPHAVRPGQSMGGAQDAVKRRNKGRKSVT